jgi:hypothetical protein
LFFAKLESSSKAWIRALESFGKELRHFAGLQHFPDAMLSPKPELGSPDVEPKRIRA